MLLFGKVLGTISNAPVAHNWDKTLVFLGVLKDGVVFYCFGFCFGSCFCLYSVEFIIKIFRHQVTCPCWVNVFVIICGFMLSKCFNCLLLSLQLEDFSCSCVAISTFSTSLSLAQCGFVELSICWIVFACLKGKLLKLVATFQKTIVIEKNWLNYKWGYYLHGDCLVSSVEQTTS